MLPLRLVSSCLRLSRPRRGLTARGIPAGVILALVSISPLRAEKLVTVRSVVDPAYAARRAAEVPPRIETYVFVRGKYYNEIPMDSYLERMDLRTIASTLVPDLKKRNFEPTTNLRTADLLLVVHWGVTLANENNAELFARDPDGLRQASEAFAGASATMENPETRGALTPMGVAGVLESVMETGLNLRREQAGSVDAYRRNEERGATNSELLGFQTAMARENEAPFPTAMGDTLRLMANEERYFIIVMAYDAAALRQSGRRQRLWTTRMSIRAAGVNFAIALDRLSGAGAEFHGQPQNGLVFETSRDRKKIPVGKVDIGEAIVIGDEPPARR